MNQSCDDLGERNEKMGEKYQTVTNLEGEKRVLGYRLLIATILKEDERGVESYE